MTALRGVDLRVEPGQTYGASRRARERRRCCALLLEAEDRLQERADRIYLDAVDRHTNPELPGRDESSPGTT